MSTSLPIRSQSPETVRSPIFLSRALRRENALSIRLKSGLYGGRKRRVAPMWIVRKWASRPMSIHQRTAVWLFGTTCTESRRVDAVPRELFIKGFARCSQNGACPHNIAARILKRFRDHHAFKFADTRG